MAEADGCVAVTAGAGTGKTRMLAERYLHHVRKHELSPLAIVAVTFTEKAAAEMVRYAPRRITLLPGQPQAVRLSARPAPDLPDGEYRVHMSFRAIPAALSPEEAQKQAAAGGLTIRLTPVYGITIPVIVRKGQLQATATLANPHLESVQSRPTLMLDLHRSGTRSVFGELLVRPAGGGDPK